MLTKAEALLQQKQSDRISGFLSKTSIILLSRWSSIPINIRAQDNVALQSARRLIDFVSLKPMICTKFHIIIFIISVRDASKQ